MSIFKNLFCKDVLVELDNMVSTNAWMTAKSESLEKRLEIYEKPHFIITTDWRWFGQEEFHCPCGNDHPQNISTELISRLDSARTYADIPFKITSGYRCEAHNIDVGGSKTSSHLEGIAVDIACAKSQKRFILLEALLWVGFRRIGIADSFIHVDLDPDKTSPCVWLYT